MRSFRLIWLVPIQLFCVYQKRGHLCRCMQLTSQQKLVAAVLLSLAIVFFISSRAYACSVCFGAPGHPLTEGLRVGVLVLLSFVLTVIGGIVAFFINLRIRSKKLGF